MHWVSALDALDRIKRDAMMSLIKFLKKKNLVACGRGGPGAEPRRRVRGRSPRLSRNELKMFNEQISHETRHDLPR